MRGSRKMVVLYFSEDDMQMSNLCPLLRQERGRDRIQVVSENPKPLLDGAFGSM